MSWSEYEAKYADLLEKRSNAIHSDLKNIDLDHACLLCSEPTPEKCHRRLSAEWLQKQGLVTKIVHL